MPDNENNEQPKTEEKAPEPAPQQESVMDKLPKGWIPMGEHGSPWM